eukprot:snap_masked-scaffold_1-processed-gene-28.23-mRNA-1 protein AED:0.12 eAED:0.12 QI:0/-1/0/1/-1/1/1/0/362
MSFQDIKELDNLFGTRVPPKFFVGGLSHSTTDESLAFYFSKFGPLAQAEVMTDHYTMLSRGFGFVTFQDSFAAKKVYSMRKQHTIDGKLVEVKLAVPKPEMLSQRKSPRNCPNVYEPFQNLNLNIDAFIGQPGHAAMRASDTGKKASPISTSSSVSLTSMMENPFTSAPQANLRFAPLDRKVFVGGLLYATGHESLRIFFESFGPVKSAEVIYNRDTKKSRGFGFVVFQSPDSVRACLDQQRKSSFKIDGKRIEVKLCESPVPRAMPRHSVTGLKYEANLDLYKTRRDFIRERHEPEAFDLRRSFSLPVNYRGASYPSNGLFDDYMDKLELTSNVRSFDNGLPYVDERNDMFDEFEFLNFKY